MNGKRKVINMNVNIEFCQENGECNRKCLDSVYKIEISRRYIKIFYEMSRENFCLTADREDVSLITNYDNIILKLEKKDCLAFRCDRVSKYGERQKWEM